MQNFFIFFSILSLVVLALAIAVRLAEPNPNQQHPDADNVEPSAEEKQSIAGAINSYARKYETGEAQRSKHEAKVLWWARAAAVGAWIYTAITAVILIAAIQSAYEAKRGAGAMEAANQINRDVLVASQRPWIQIYDVAIIEPLTTDVNGLRITLTFRLKNVGHSPAQHIIIAPIVMANGPGNISENPVTDQTQACSHIRNRPFSPYLDDMLFPDEVSLPHTITVYLDSLTISRAISMSDRWVTPTIYGCIDYGFSFDGGHHQTGFIYDVMHAPHGAIDVDRKIIPISEIQLFKSNLGGFYAD